MRILARVAKLFIERESRTNHFGINPRRGGIPPSERSRTIIM